jgi:hypothetical protein
MPPKKPKPLSPDGMVDKGNQVERFTVALNSKAIQHLGRYPITLGDDFRATAPPAGT